jgi:hypothetical protein
LFHYAGIVFNEESPIVFVSLPLGCSAVVALNTIAGAWLEVVHLKRVREGES